jgi:hypothetical protein
MVIQTTPSLSSSNSNNYVTPIGFNINSEPIDDNKTCEETETVLPYPTSVNSSLPYPQMTPPHANNNNKLVASTASTNSSSSCSSQEILNPINCSTTTPATPTTSKINKSDSIKAKPNVPRRPTTGALVTKMQNSIMNSLSNDHSGESINSDRESKSPSEITSL